MKRFVFALIISHISLLISHDVVNAAAPVIGTITDNRSTYAGNQIPRYEKFEVTAPVTTVATNPFFPYDPMPTPVPGLTPKLGVSVDGLFLPPGQSDWAKAYRQPAFFAPSYTDATKNGTDWFYPTGNYAWKVRFAPNLTGTWQYKLTAQDAGGNSESGIQSFTVTTSSSHGFIKVSSTDTRYFEFTDGTYFPDLAINDSLSLKNPITDNQTFLSKLGTNGIQVMRFWLSGWSIYSSAWTAWTGIRGDYDAYLPRTGLFVNRAESTPASPSSTMALVYAENSPTDQNTYWFDACRFTGGFPPQIPVKQNTSYHLKIRYQAKGISGPRNAAYPGYGLVAKIQNPNDGNWHQQCYNGGDPQNGLKISGYGHDTAGWTADAQGNLSSTTWSYLESDWNSGTNNFLPVFYVALENANNLTATVNGLPYNWHPYVFIDSIQLTDPTGVNVVPRDSMSYLEHVVDRNAYAFDKVLDTAHQQGVYLKMVILEKNEDTQNEIGYQGQKIDADGNDNDGFYANDPAHPRAVTPVRWYQQAWWRYLQARWGYSPNIHSWEVTNESDPYNGNDYIQTDELGKYMHCTAFGVSVGFGDSQKCTNANPNSHLVTNSFWHSFPKTEFWANSKFPNVDYADVHMYIAKDGSQDDNTNTTHYLDTALTTYDLSLLDGAKRPGGADKPVMRGETGLTLTSTEPASPETDSDTKGLWLHDLIWGGINPGGLIEAYWHVSQIYNGAKDLRPLYKHYYDFISNIPLNNGHYQDAAATASDSNVRAWGQKDNVGQTATHAHLWINHKNDTWYNLAINHAAASRLNGTVTLGGFAPNASLPIEYWNFDTNVTLTKTTATATADGTGTITLNLAALPATVIDTGIKIGDYSLTPTPTPAPAPIAGDFNSDGVIDFSDWLAFIPNFGKALSQFQLVTGSLVSIFDLNKLIGYLYK